jgi:hypothetical protein
MRVRNHLEHILVDVVGFFIGVHVCIPLINYGAYGPV